MPVPRSAPTAAALAASIAVLVSGCGGGSSAAPQTSQTKNPAGATSTDSATPAPQGLAVPGIPDPCALLPADQVQQVAHLEPGSRSGAVPSNSGGRSCAYNAGHPDAVTISLTPVSKAGFDTFRQSQSGVTDLPGIGVEAYKSAQTPGVVDVFKGGFDLNIFVIHADTSDSASADAKALAAQLAPKL